MSHTRNHIIHLFCHRVKKTLLLSLHALNNFYFVVICSKLIEPLLKVLDQPPHLIALVKIWNYCLEIREGSMNGI